MNQLYLFDTQPQRKLVQRTATFVRPGVYDIDIAEPLKTESGRDFADSIMAAIEHCKYLTSNLAS